MRILKWDIALKQGCQKPHPGQTETTDHIFMLWYVNPFLLTKASSTISDDGVTLLFVNLPCHRCSQTVRFLARHWFLFSFSFQLMFHSVSIHLLFVILLCRVCAPWNPEHMGFSGHLRLLLVTRSPQFARHQCWHQVQILNRNPLIDNADTIILLLFCCCCHYLGVILKKEMGMLTPNQKLKKMRIEFSTIE